MSKIGIVGGSGFIGSALARTLSKSFTIKIFDIKPLPKDLEGELECARPELVCLMLLTWVA